MGENKNKSQYIIPLLILLVVFVAYFWGWDIGACLNKDKVAVDLVELTTMINQQIDEGKKSGTFYIKGISEEDVSDINNYICSLNGSVSKYGIIDKARGGMKVMFTYELSDNYYVYKKYTVGEEIPSERQTAQKLYDEVVNIIKTTISYDMTDYEKELAIHDYIVSTCQYGQVEYSKEYAFCAYGALVQKKAVCNGYAQAMALLLNCLGIENEIVTGWGADELHAWNIVNLDGQWYQLDVTWNDALPDTGEDVKHKYFNVTDDIMDDEHTWDKENYPACESEEYNYYKKNNLIASYYEFQGIVKFTASRDKNGVVEAVVKDYSQDLYNFDFIFEISGIDSFLYGVEEYGDYHVITIYLNKKD